MLRKRLPAALVISCLTFAYGCSNSGEEPGAWPEGLPAPYDNTVLRTDVTVAPSSVNDNVTVEPNRLVFSAGDAAQVAQNWPVGKPVVGGRSQTAGASSNNVFGFMRKVKEIRTEGDQVIVETEPAALGEIFTGDILQYADFSNAEPVELGDVDPNVYFNTPPPTAAGFSDGSDAAFGAGAGRSIESSSFSNQGVTISQPLGASIDISRNFHLSGESTALHVDRQFVVGQGTSKEATVRVIGDVAVGASIDFDPAAWLSFDVDAQWSVTNPVELSFEVGMQGDLATETNTTFDLDFEVLSGSTSDLQEVLQGSPQQTGQGISVTLYAGKPMRGPPLAGIPTTFRNELTLDCAYEVRGGMKGKASVKSAVRPLRAGVSWSSDDGFGLQSTIFPVASASATGSMQGAAEAALECGLMPRIKWLIGDVGGPYVGARAALKATSSFSESCTPAPKTQFNTVDTNLTVTSRLNVLVGGEVDISIFGQGINLGIGPWSVLEMPFGTLYDNTWSFDDAGFGTCVGTCDNGTQDGLETDIDCGGPGCDGCGQDGMCNVDVDCSSGSCSVDSACVLSACFDGRQNQDETGIDCGGSTCAPCSYGAVCTADSDCASGICAATGGCVGHTCEDNRLSGDESDVDCGGSWCLSPQGGLKACTVGQDCNAPRDCQTGICSASNTCAADLCSDGRKNGAEVGIDCGASCGFGCNLGATCTQKADCLSNICSSSGVCIDDTCADGLKGGDESDVDCGGDTCGPRCALTQRCDEASDCGSGICSQFGRCVATLCEDSRHNNGEIDIDCGGPCEAKCGTGQLCGVDDDCVSDICTYKGRCAEDACSDFAQGENETAVDCGGADCEACGLGKGCIENADCRGDFVCSGGPNPFCVADTCSDQTLTAGEADIDCGGTCFRDCATGSSCFDDDDCLSDICNGDTNTCVSDACLDRVRNGFESDVDCGGPCDLKCALDETCNNHGDCASGVCNQVTNVCVSDGCFDGVQSGDETAVDCGGPCAAKCELAQGCGTGTDCVSEVCHSVNEVCVATSCEDGALTPGEADVDCGGPCAFGCGFGQSCSAGTDCASGTCLPDNTCTVDPCSDGEQNGDETDVDCGGSCSANCDVGELCGSGNDCGSGYCNVNTSRCVATHCEDGIANVDEGDVDCGGSSCTGCGQGLGCNTSSDCANHETSVGCHPVDKICRGRCFDGIADFGESDVDCGAVCASDTSRCSEGQGCNDYTDCDGGACNESGLCTEALPRSCIDVNPTVDGTYEARPIPYLVRSYQVYCEFTSFRWTLAGVVNIPGIDSASSLSNLNASFWSVGANDYTDSGMPPIDTVIGAHPTDFVGSFAWTSWVNWFSHHSPGYGQMRMTAYLNGVEVFDSADFLDPSIHESNLIPSRPYHQGQRLIESGTFGPLGQFNVWDWCTGNGPSDTFSCNTTSQFRLRHRDAVADNLEFSVPECINSQCDTETGSVFARPAGGGSYGYSFGPTVSSPADFQVAFWVQ